jgi:hypothetical protein
MPEVTGGGCAGTPINPCVDPELMRRRVIIQKLRKSTTSVDSFSFYVLQPFSHAHLVQAPGVSRVISAGDPF